MQHAAADDADATPLLENELNSAICWVLDETERLSEAGGVLHGANLSARRQGKTEHKDREQATCETGHPSDTVSFVAVFRRAFLAFGMCLLALACSKSSPPTPSAGVGGGESITGRERLGWDQAAASTTELATFRYAIYVDNVRSVLADVTCGQTPGPNGYPCSGRLPAMSNGSHVLELAAFTEAQGIQESGRSQPLRVTVAAVVASSGATNGLTSGSIIETSDGVQLRADVLYEGLREPRAIAIAADERAFVGTADGVLIIKDGALAGPPQLTDGAAIALDLSPNFSRDGHVFVTQVLPPAAESRLFRTSRVTDMGGWLADRRVILEHGPASADPAAALRFSADGKLHLAFDDGGDPVGADRMAEWRGKLLRMEPDGRTPRDQAAASPVLWRGLASPRGFDWTRDGRAIWLADGSTDGVERLRLIVATSTEPRRATQSASYVLPQGLGASSVAFYRNSAIPPFAGDLFVSGKSGGYLLRIRFGDTTDRLRPTTTERLMEGMIGEIAAMTVGPGGAIYFATDTALVRLTCPRCRG